ncbi:MAG: nuclear transport factor 2 family protein [Sphingomonadales bacterium]|nr:MAG: nuclear transport factor 2 family protein [Sphingomonadales bacterium]
MTVTDSDPRVQRLLDIEALKRLKATYWRCWDTKDFEGWLSLFVDEATLLVDMEVDRGQQVPTMLVEGKQRLRETVCVNNRFTVTVHQGHSPEFEFLSATEAKGIWAMHDIVEREKVAIFGHGHYRETYRKADGDWKFTSIHLTRIRYEAIEPRQEPTLW